jgi:hypothetical protein
MNNEIKTDKIFTEEEFIYLNSKISEDKIRFFNQKGYSNFLVVLIEKTKKHTDFKTAKFERLEQAIKDLTEEEKNEFFSNFKLEQ